MKFSLECLLVFLPLGCLCISSSDTKTLLSAQDSNDDTPVANVQAAIAAMNAFYNETDGRWNTSAAWWVSGGGALQSLLDYMHRTGE